MSTVTTKAAVGEQEDRTKAALGSFLIHAALLAMLIFYPIGRSETPIPPTVIELDLTGGGGGDNAAAGLPDEGEGDDPAPPGQQMEDPTSTEPVEKPEPTPPSKTTPPPPSNPTPPVKTDSRVTTPNNTPTSTDPNAAAIKRAEDQKRKEEQDAKRQADELRRQEDARRQAEANAAAEKARQEQEARDKKKGQFGGSFGKPGSTGTGQGNTGKPGNQGIPGGTGDNPFGKTNGSGGGSGGGTGGGIGASVGGGLGGRAVVARGKINDDSQKSGRVVVEVCVDGNGNVMNAEYKSLGSTTSDLELRNKAITAAKGYKFASSDAAKQCGTITFNFRLQ